jgi:excisionase family DNA binding protein
MVKDFLSIPELSQYLNVKESTLYAKVEAGELPHYRIGRLIRFKKNDVDRWLEKQRRDPLDPAAKAKLILNPVHKPRLSIDKLIRKSIDEVKGSEV